LSSHASQTAEQRFALVIGNDEYRAAKLATSANDAGLVADALQSAGFTVTGARNLDQATLRESFREFIGQVSAAGPDAVALVYLAGIGLQFNGENYFVPVDADIQRDVDVPLQAIRVSDFTQPLASLPGRVKIVILDAARQNPFGGGNQPLAGGLALVEPMHSMAIAFNAAPGTVAPDEQGPYGAYATSLTEMIAAGGLGLDDLFARLRLRVSDLTQGAEIPWYASQIDGPFFMTELAAGAPPPPNVMPIADVRAKSIRDFPNVDDAYAAALDRDSIDGYEQFLAVYPHSPYSERIAGMLAVRREAIIWRRCVIADTPPAYWSYLRRYPNGPHVWDARRRLAMLAAAYDPPPDFAYYDFGVPPPPPDELGYVDQPPLTPLLARISAALTGNTLVGFRILPALALGALVVMTAAMSRRLGAGRTGQLLAALAAATCGEYLGAMHELTTTTPDFVFWAVTLLLVMQLLVSQDRRWWVAIGGCAGVASEAKWNIAFLVAALAAGFAFTDARRLLRSRYLLIGGLIFAALAAPDIVWQATHGWPALDVFRALQTEAGHNRVVYWPGQIAYTGVVLTPLWVAGAIWSLRSAAARRFRPVAIACNPATPAPMTRMRAALIVPAAVIIIGKARPNSAAASTTAL